MIIKLITLFNLGRKIFDNIFILKLKYYINNFDDEKLGHIYMQIIDFDINWLKTQTQKWIDDKISSFQYENRINHAIQFGLIKTETIEQDSLPEWMKMNAKNWIDGKISQKEYFNIVKFIAS